jgi:general secretion pathway protein I
VNRRSRQGFTLLETVLAMTIMASGLLLLVQTWGGSFIRMQRAQSSFEVTALLERKMIDYELKYRGKSLEEIQDSEEGEFEGYPEFTWKMESKKLEFPNLASALYSKDGGVDQMTATLITSFSDTLSKSVKEVTITVTHTAAGKKPVPYSITTYFCDYEANLKLGLPGGG